jgi:hypothetical protein
MAEAFHSNRAMYDTKARSMTQKFASMSLEDWRRKILGPSDAASHMWSATGSVLVFVSVANHADKRTGDGFMFHLTPKKKTAQLPPEYGCWDARSGATGFPAVTDHVFASFEYVCSHAVAHVWRQRGGDAETNSCCALRPGWRGSYGGKRFTSQYDGVCDYD